MIECHNVVSIPCSALYFLHLKPHRYHIFITDVSVGKISLESQINCWTLLQLTNISNTNMTITQSIYNNFVQELNLAVAESHPKLVIVTLFSRFDQKTVIYHGIRWPLSMTAEMFPLVTLCVLVFFRAKAQVLWTIETNIKLSDIFFYPSFPTQNTLAPLMTWV